MSMASFSDLHIQPPRRSVRGQLVRLLVPLALLPFLIVGGLVYFRARALLVEQVRSQLDINIHNLATELDTWLTTAQIRLDNLSRTPDFHTLASPLADGQSLDRQTRAQTRQDIETQLAEINTLPGNINFTDFLILNPNGDVLLASNPDWEGDTLPPEILALTTHGQTGSEMFYAQSPVFRDGLNFIAHTRFTSESGGTIFLVGILNQIPVQNILKDARSRLPQSNAYLITRTGDFIALDVYTEDLVVREPTRIQSAALLPLKEEYIHTATTEQHLALNLRSFDQTPTIGVYTWIDSLDGGLVFEIPTAVAFRQLQTLTPFTLIAAFLTLGLVGLALWLGAERFTRPILEITRTAQEFARGNWAARAAEREENEIGLLARTLNTMADELSGLYQSLSAQVAEQTRALQTRSKQLEATALVARDTAAIRDLDQLLAATTELISQYFGFYHAGIFLLDQSNRYAVLQAANSEGGRRMLARGHKLEVGLKGVVGHVAATGEPRIALDVGEDRYFFDNPDLPETRSEMALPLKVQNRVIGVLDVQSRQPGAFTEEDVEVLQIMADQIALAIENARLLEQSQATVAELQRFLTGQTLASWERILGEQPLAYRFDRVSVRPADPQEIPTHPQQHTTQPQTFRDQDGYQYLTIPLQLRGVHFGDISLRKDPNDTPWTADDVQLAGEVGRQIGAAIENARLLEETQQRAQQELLMRQIGERLRATLDMDTILRTAVQELQNNFDLESAEIQLTAPRGNGKESQA